MPRASALTGPVRMLYAVRPTTTLDAYRANQLACWIVESQFESGVLKYRVFRTHLDAEAIGAGSKVHIVKLQISAIL